MNSFAYTVEVRDELDTDWMVAEIMVSPPGVAPRDCFDFIKEGRENYVRVRRIKHSTEFAAMINCGVPIMIKNESAGTPFEFHDRVVTTTED